MKHVAVVRKKLGIRTIFNLLGPLANPAGATYQLLGVGLPELRPLIASALGMLGTERALVVSGGDGLGEVTVAGPTDVTQIDSAGEREFEWQPTDFGVPQSSLEAIQVQGPDESAAIVRQVLAGESGPARDIVLLNAAAGLLTAGRCETPAEGAALAAEAIDRGAAAQLLMNLARLSHEQ
jgi:anthranilate phosphoribosyltransferase